MGFQEIYNSWEMQLAMDFCRILLIVIAVLILWKLTTEVEAVKILQHDPCRLCENKTGAVCFFYNSVEDGVKIIEKRIPLYPNYTDFKLS